MSHTQTCDAAWAKVVAAHDAIDATVDPEGYAAAQRLLDTAWDEFRQCVCNGAGE